MTETLILRTRPQTVEARRFDGIADNQRELVLWTNGWPYGTRAIRWFDPITHTVREAGIGDWIVRDSFGRHTPATDAGLAREYDRILSAVAE